MIYDFKASEMIQDVIIQTIDDIVDDIIDEYRHLHRYDSLAVYVPVKYSKIILEKLMNTVNNLVIDKDSKFDLLKDNSNKILIEIWYDGIIFIDNAYENNKISTMEYTLSYVYDEFSMNDVKEVTDDDNSVLVFGFNDEIPRKPERKCCNTCKVCICDNSPFDDEDKNTTIKYYINNKCVDDETFRNEMVKIKDEFSEIDDNLYYGALSIMDDWDYLLRFPRKFLSSL